MVDSSNFVYPKFKVSNADLYIVRSAIFQALVQNLFNFNGKLLDAGCGKLPYKNYILENSNVVNYVGLDIESALEYDKTVKPDFTWNGVTMPFENESFDCAIATEVLEHCAEPEIFLKEVNRVLKHNGTFFLTVPFLWNLHEVPNDAYRYTPFSLERHLRNSGFSKVNINATGGWHLAMAQMLGLWLKRSPLSPKLRKYLTFIVLPIMRYLIKISKNERVAFTDGQMITGLYCIAEK